MENVFQGLIIAFELCNNSLSTLKQTFKISKNKKKNKKTKKQNTKQNTKNLNKKHNRGSNIFNYTSSKKYVVVPIRIINIIMGFIIKTMWKSR
jgi:hypothetical protein